MRDELLQQIISRLGTTSDPHLPLDVRKTGNIKMDGYVIKNICYQSRPDFYVTGNLYIPDGAGPFPGVLGMHGHWAHGAGSLQTTRMNKPLCYCRSIDNRHNFRSDA